MTWVLAFSFSSLAAVAAGSNQGDSATLEVTLARARAPYLVLELAGPSLSVRVRAMELQSVPLLAVRAVRQGPDGDAGSPPVPGTPQVWRIVEGTAGEWRRVVAPVELVPYVEEGQRPEPTPLAGPTHTPPPLPDRFVVTTDSPWRLAVAPTLDAVVPIGFWQRVFRGWRRMIGRPEPPTPPTLVLVVHSAEDARRLVHLFRPGMAVLVGGGKAVASTSARP
ncbi:MAG: hypothetical protein AB1Z65_05365 [Candidatus Sulfomarinibacteraceae bacterium]